jgi:hypothetical protein
VFHSLMRWPPAILPSLALCTVLHAQCELQLQPGAPVSGPDGYGNAAVRLPGGDLVLGGSFVLADGSVANNIARYDGTSWSALGGGCNSIVYALAVAPNGDLIAGGAFTAAGGAPATRVARWNGRSWAPPSAGLNSTVEALLVRSNGDVIVGGSFTDAGGTAARGIARWDGVAWQALGGSLNANGVVYALAELPNGDLLAAGRFSSIAGVPATSIARWDGATWAGYPGCTAQSSIYALAPLPTGEIVVGGTVILPGSFDAVAVARGNGTSMVALAGSNLAYARDLLVAANGDLIAGGVPNSSSIVPQAVVRFSGGAWAPVSPAYLDQAHALLPAANGDLIAVGSSYAPSGFAAARFDGVAWTGIGAAPSAKVAVSAGNRRGDVLVGGDFTALQGVAANSIARWNGNGFSALGSGIAGQVTAIAGADDGSFVVSGEFAMAGGVAASRIARWDGTAWSALGIGLTEPARQIAANAIGQAVVVLQSGGAQHFDGATWEPVPLIGSQIAHVATDSDGSFVLGGLFALPGTGVQTLARFANGSLTAMPQLPPIGSNPLPFPTALDRDVDGRPLAAAAGSVFRFESGAWVPLGALPTSSCQRLASLPNGDVLAVSSNGSNSQLVRRRVGGVWTVLFETFHSAGGGGLHVAVGAAGDVFLAGNVQAANGVVGNRLLRALAPCAATVASAGSGCSGSAGPLGLVADNRAWLGGVFRSRATGLAAGSLAIHVLGLQATALPLPGPVGCTLFVTPDATEVYVPAAGAVQPALAVPNAPALVGAQVRTQVVAVEPAAGGMLSFAGSNALVLTLGAL